MRSFDRLAKPYETLERWTFGRTLERARSRFLPQLRSSPRGLLIGDGDGRFSSQLLTVNPTITLDSVDFSPAMLKQAQARAGERSERLNPICVDATQHLYPTNHYDFIGLNFSLDCLTQTQVDALLPKLENALCSSGRIVYADFRAEAFWQKSIVRVLYLCFRVSTGLPAKALPRIVWSEQIQLVDEKRFLGGLIETCLLEKKSATGAAPGNCLERR